MAKGVKKKKRGVVGKKKGKKEREKKNRITPVRNRRQKVETAQNRDGSNFSMTRAHQMPRPLNKKIAHQLLVHGLPGEFLDGTKGGLQERALNKLLTNLGKEEIGDRGITLQQEQIIGAHPIKPSSSSDKSPIARLTVKD